MLLPEDNGCYSNRKSFFICRILIETESLIPLRYKNYLQIDRAYYAPNDSVADVTNRFAAFYGCSLQTDYRMLCSTNFDPSCSADILSRHENFKAVVDNETTLGRKKFLIVPLLKPSVAPDHLMQKYVILYRQEIGGFPIIIEVFSHSTFKRAVFN